MVATKVGIREFRAGLADFIESDTPIAVTRHGQTVGFFIPTKTDREAEVAALRTAAARLDELLDLEEPEVDVIVEEFKSLRRKVKQ